MFGAACAISHIAGHESLEVLEGHEQCLGKPSLQVVTGSWVCRSNRKLGLPVHNCLFARFVNSPGFVYVERPCPVCACMSCRPGRV